MRLIFLRSLALLSMSAVTFLALARFTLLRDFPFVSNPAMLKFLRSARCRDVALVRSAPVMPLTFASIMLSRFLLLKSMGVCPVKFPLSLTPWRFEAALSCVVVMPVVLRSKYPRSRFSVLNSVKLTPSRLVMSLGALGSFEVRLVWLNMAPLRASGSRFFAKRKEVPVKFFPVPSNPVRSTPARDE